VLVLLSPITQHWQVLGHMPQIRCLNTAAVASTTPALNMIGSSTED